jgi:hypothetical protein
MRSPYPNYKTSNPLLSDYLDVNNPFLAKQFYCNDVEYDGIRNC